MIAPMTAAVTRRKFDPRLVGLAAAGVALVAFGAALWVKFGALVYFYTLAAAFIGCFI